LLFRWFIGFGIEDPVWDATNFTKNRDRLLEGDIAFRFLAAMLAHDKGKGLVSSEHFSVDGILLDAWASAESFRPKDASGEPPGDGRNGGRDFHGEQRKNDTHASITDPEARLYRKGLGKEARLAFMGHALMENRNGLIVGAVATRASGHAGRLAAVALIQPQAERAPVTLGAEKGYDSADFVIEPREARVTPQVAQHENGRRSAIDRRTTRHPGYAISSASANASRKRSAGPRRWPGCARYGTPGWPRSIGNSPWRWPLRSCPPAQTARADGAVSGPRHPGRGQPSDLPGRWSVLAAINRANRPQSTRPEPKNSNIGPLFQR
jgi:Transposase domain (DUF772)